MQETEITLANDEDIVRVFLRRPNEPWGFSKLRKADFARQMSNHSGISMLRLKYLDNRQEALNWFKSDKLKGLAICKAKQLKELDLHFIASAPTAKHISVRCQLCDLAVNYPIFCKPEAGDACLINRRAPVTLLQQLYEIFSDRFASGFASVKPHSDALTVTGYRVSP